MSATQLNYVPEITFFSYERGKQIISILLLVYIGIKFDFGVILQPLTTNNTLVMYDMGLLAGLLAILFLVYSLIINLKSSTQPQVESVSTPRADVECDELSKFHTANLYFWTGCICCVFFVLI